MKLTIVPTPWHRRTALNLTHVMADGAGVAFLSAEQFFRIGQVNMGIQIQAIGASVTPSFTLGDPDRAVDPDQTSPVTWTAQAALAAGEMKVYPMATTGIKLVFSGAGEAIIASF